LQWPQLSIPSPAYLQLEKIVSDKKIIGNHVRRGDYKNYAEEFGLLSARYYSEALKEIESQIPNAKLWLFSDEPEEVSNEFKGSGITFNYVVKDNELSPAESITLMSKLSGLIIANSTFSWWAGFLSKGHLVVAPKPWFRSEGSWLKEENLIPDSWVRVSADWTL